MILNIFTLYRDYGLSVVPIMKSEKRPVGRWEEYQKRRPTDTECKQWDNIHERIGIVCGKASDGVECIDFDNHKETGHDAKEWLNMFLDTVDSNSELQGLRKQFIIEETQRKGYHVVYRIKDYDTIDNNKNQKLALKDNIAFIETRGQGGQFVAAPTEGYTLVQNDYKNIPTITKEQRNLLLNICRSMSQETTKQNAIVKVEADIQTRQIVPYNQDESIIFKLNRYLQENNLHRQFLEKIGFKFVRYQGTEELWQRPGSDKKAGEVSAIYGNKGGKYDREFLFNFSTNTAGFDVDHRYDNADLLCIASGIGERVNNENIKQVVKYAKSCGYIENDFEPAKRKNSTKSKEERTERKNSKEQSQYHASGDNPTEEVVSFFKNKGLEKFWRVKIQKGNSNIVTIEIIKNKLYKLVEAAGFGELRRNVDDYVIIKLTDNIIDLSDMKEIVKYIRDVVIKLPDKINDFPEVYKEQLEEVLDEKISSFSDQASRLILEIYDVSNLIRDNAENCFVCFRNCVVKVDKEEANLTSLKELGKIAWREWIINRDFNMVSMEEIEKGVYYQFERNISTSPTDEEQDEQDRTQWIFNEKKWQAGLCMLGFFASTYKDPSMIKDIILCEEKINEDDESNGRTGKGLRYNYLKHYFPILEIDGKNFKQDDPFKWDALEPYHRHVVIDDLNKNFDFKKRFAEITGAWTINKKHTKKYILSFDKTPKLLMTTNFTVLGDSASYTERKYEWEHSPFYDSIHKPADYNNGKRFFDKWDNPDENGISEWNRADSFFIMILQYYLEFGLIEYTRKNLDQRKLDQQVPRDLQDIFANLVETEDFKTDVLSARKVMADFKNLFVPNNQGYSKVGYAALGKMFNAYLTKMHIPYTRGLVRSKFNDGNVIRGWRLGNKSGE